MAISFITGKPGGGKGLLAMQQVIDELVQGNRPIITNLAVRVEPWVNGSHQPMIGLRGYLLKRYGKHFDCDKRIHILPDEEIASFYLWRVLDGKLVKSSYNAKKTREGDEVIVDYDTSNGAASGPCMYVVDEAWKFYGSRNWQRTGEGVLFYNAQHRKFGDDVLIVTQHTKQIDPAVQRVAQDFWVVRNHSKLSIGIFRQPNVFSVAIYETAPTGSIQEPMSRKLFTLDKLGLAQTYDTSAGVGLSGRMVADIHGRKKGLPWWGILIAAAVIVVALGETPKLIEFLVSFGIHRKMAKPHAASPLETKGVLPLTQDTLRDSAHQSDGVISSNAPVVCTGYCVLSPVMAYATLSDGRVASLQDGDIQILSKHRVKVFGSFYDVSLPPTNLPPPDYQPQQISYAPVAADDAYDSPRQPVTVIGQNYLRRTAGSRPEMNFQSSFSSQLQQPQQTTVQQGSYP